MNKETPDLIEGLIKYNRGNSSRESEYILKNLSNGRDRAVWLSYGHNIVEFEFSIPSENQYERGYIIREETEMMEESLLFLNKSIDSLEDYDGITKVGYGKWSVEI